MWQNDGEVRAIVALPSLLIHGAGWEINMPNDFNEENQPEELEFIRENLLKPGFRSRDGSFVGGMVTPMAKVIKDMTFAPIEGARFYELVWRKQNDKIFLHKIASRDNLTCYPVADDNGDFAGFWQRVDSTIRNGSTKSIEVFIRHDKALGLIMQPEFGGLNGLSQLKAAHYHWDKKHKLYYIGHLAAELQTIPTAIVKHDNEDESIINVINQAVDERGLNSRITVPDKDIDIEELDGGGSTGKVNIKELIDHHNSMISKSMLAQFIDLSSEGSATGSRSLGETFVDLYLQSIQSLMQDIETKFNTKIIPQLIDYNFGTKIYPEFSFKPIQDEKKKMLKEIFLELVKNKQTGKINTSIIEKMADEFNLDISEDLPAEINTNVDNSDMPEDGNEDEDVELQEQPIRTQLTLQEQRLDIQGLASNMDNFEERLLEELESVIKDNQGDLLNRLEVILENKDITALQELVVTDKGEFIEVIQGILAQVYEFSKLNASAEIEAPAPSTTQVQRKINRLEARNNGDQLLNTLENRIVNLTTSDISNEVDPEETKTSVIEEINNFVGSTLGLGIAQLVTGGVNRARKDVFRANEDRIIGYIYTAVLDNRTTDYCRSLSGTAYRLNDPIINTIWPPNHFRCRSTFVPILNGENADFSSNSPKSFGSVTQFKDQAALSAENVEKQLTKLIDEL